MNKIRKLLLILLLIALSFSLRSCQEKEPSRQETKEDLSETKEANKNKQEDETKASKATKEGKGSKAETSKEGKGSEEETSSEKNGAENLSDLELPEGVKAEVDVGYAKVYTGRNCEDIADVMGYIEIIDGLY